MSWLLGVLLLVPGMLFGQTEDKEDKEDTEEIVVASSGKADIAAYCAAMEGKVYFLRVDVIRVQHMIGGIDATNILPGPEVSYRAKFGGFRQIQSSTAEDFAEEVRLENQNRKKGTMGSTVRNWKVGSKVTIHKLTVGGKEIQCDITEEGDSKSRIRFKFDKHKDAYNLATVQEMFAFTFAEKKEDVGGKAVEITLGMSIEDVIKLKGNPKSRVNLGTKVILTYDDMKLIFLDNKLSDVQ